MEIISDVYSAKDLKLFLKKLMGYEKAIALIVMPALILAIYLCIMGFGTEGWKLDTFKILLQFLFIIVIGGAVTLLFSQYGKECEKRETKKEEYRKLLAEIIREYNSAKRIRRLLRAEARIVGIEGEMAIKAEPYKKYMRELVNVQLKFEYLKRFVENTDYAELKSIESELKSIESYLNHIVKEYENNYITFSNSEFGPIKKFSFLEEFLIKDENGQKYGEKFGKEFKIKGEKAMKELYRILTAN